jgi:hypothetical protein
VPAIVDAHFGTVRPDEAAFRVRWARFHTNRQGHRLPMDR